MRKFIGISIIVLSLFLDVNAQCDTVLADFSSTAPSCTGDSVDFLFTETPYAGMVYSWDFGSGATPATSALQNPGDVVYATPGLKLVTLMITYPLLGCTDTKIHGILINETPAPAFTDDGPKCEEEGVNFTYTGTTDPGWTYDWDFGPGASPSVSSSLNPSGIVYSGAGVKTITLTVSSSSCTEKATQTITINPKPNAAYSTVSPVCTDNAVSFSNTGTTGAAYAWDFGTGATPAASAAENPAGVVYSTAGIKSIEQIVTLGTCSDTSIKTITVIETPLPSFTSTAPQCEGAQVDFTYTGTTSPLWTYSWDFGPGATPSTSTAQNPQGIIYTGSGSKSVTVTVSNGICSGIATQAITINETPIAGLGHSAPGCTGAGVDFSNTGTTGATYNWNFGIGAAPGTSTAENPTGVVYSIAGVKSIQQIVTLATCSDTTLQTITIEETPSPNFTHTAPQCEGAAVDFTYTGSTGTLWTYDWDFGSGANPSTSTAQDPQGVQYTGFGNKTVTLTVNNGTCSGTTTQVLTINETPASGISSSAPGCTGSGVDFSNTGSTGAIYFWNLGSGATPATATTENLTGVVYSSAGVKQIQQIVTIGGCRDTAMYAATIVETPAPNFTHTGPQCEGAGVDFTYTGSASTGWTYDWDFGTGSTPGSSTAQDPQGVIYNGAGSKTVTLTVTNGLCPATINQSVQINPSPIVSNSHTGPGCTGDDITISNTGTSGAIYSWEFGAGSSPAISSLEQPGTISYSTPGIKTVLQVITLGGCVDSLYKTITVYETPTVNMLSTAPVCAGSSVNFTNTGSSGSQWSYNWDFGAGANPSASTSETPSGISYAEGGTKQVTMTVWDEHCLNSDTFNIAIDTLPLSDAGSDTIVCADGCVMIGSLPLTGYSYEWFPGTGLSSASNANTEACPIAPISIYTVTTRDVNTGCVSSDTITLSMLPSAEADAGSDVEVCVGEEVQIGTGKIEGQVYRWIPGISASQDTLPNPMVSPDSTTIYTVQVSYQGCDTITDDVMVTVHNNPIVSAGSDVTIPRGSSTQLLATGAIMYEWIPADGLSNPGIANPLASPSETTTYEVVFTDMNLCVNRDSVTITIIDADVWAPTAFTPNQDGKNDIFYIRNNGATSFEFNVYDRAGNLLFHTTNPDSGWNGTKQGTEDEVSSGAYVYSARGALSDGKEFKLQGLINLIK